MSSGAETLRDLKIRASWIDAAWFQRLGKRFRGQNGPIPIFSINAWEFLFFIFSKSFPSITRPRLVFSLKNEQRRRAAARRSGCEPNFQPNFRWKSGNPTQNRISSNWESENGELRITKRRTENHPPPNWESETGEPESQTWSDCGQALPWISTTS